MYALIETGGKQYRVAPGDVLDVELPGGKASGLGEAGTAVDFERVLLVADGVEVRVGAPLVDGAVVKAAVVGAVRGPKIRIFKTKRRKGYRRTNGHRQDLLRVRIEGIQG